MTLPTTIELCARIRDGHPCLGRISRTGVPEIVHCESCGGREAGVVYHLHPAGRLEALEVAVGALLGTLCQPSRGRWSVARRRGCDFSRLVDHLRTELGAKE